MIFLSRTRTCSKYIVCRYVIECSWLQRGFSSECVCVSVEPTQNSNKTTQPKDEKIHSQIFWNKRIKMHFIQRKNADNAATATSFGFPRLRSKRAILLNFIFNVVQLRVVDFLVWCCFCGFFSCCKTRVFCDDIIALQSIPKCQYTILLQCTHINA